MKWRKVHGIAGTTYFSADGQWTIQVVAAGGYRLYWKGQLVDEYPTMALAKAAAGP